MFRDFPRSWHDAPAALDAAGERMTESIDSPESGTSKIVYVATDDLRPEGAESTCLRPLGLCELGGACDACWYHPDHPRFSEGEQQK